ncbi:MAG: ATP-binding cassette domain-containing protein [Alphaproteobacteria bacterium]|nr:MAG: ATP-binding cassette domain-containing protein [Alphaproteobacteria bacterium]
MNDHIIGRGWHHLAALLQPDRIRRIVGFAGRSVLLASLGINLLSLALPIVLLQVYDRIIPHKAGGTLFFLILGLGTALVLDMALKGARATLAGWSGARFEHEAGRWGFDRLTRAPLEEAEKTPAGVYLDRLSGVDAIRDFYASRASMVVMDAPFVLLFLVLLGLIAGWLVVIPVAAIILAVATAHALGQALKKALDERAASDDRRYNFLIEILAGIHTIKSMAMEKLMLRRYEKLSERAALISARVTFLSGLAQNLGSTLSQLTIAAVAAVGSLQVITGDLTVGGLAACTLLSGRTVQPVLRAMTLWSRFQSIEVAERNLAAFGDLPERRHGDRRLDNLETVQVSDLSFRYGDDQPWVLRGLDLDFRRGEIVGLTGPSGSGKTTLMSLIAGRLAPSQGKVLLNGHPPAEYSEESLGKALAYIPQRPILFRGTILDNLTGFKGDAKAGDAMEIASRLGLDQVFARLPRGLETEIGDTAASQIPSGVAQRITIARALLERPQLILFDEANSALDQQSDALLRSLIASLRQDAAILIISHRPSLLAIADRRYCLEDGRLRLIETPDDAEATPDKRRAGGRP